jgi:hypothetical protein
MKKIIIISFLLSVFGNILAEKSEKYVPLGTQYKATDAISYISTNCNSYGSQYKGRSVAEFLREMEVPVGFLTLIPNYYNSNYGNEFRFSSEDANTTSSILRHQNSNLYVIYVRFTPEIKFPTTGFIREKLGKAIKPEDFEEFEQYTIVDMTASTVRGK